MGFNNLAKRVFPGLIVLIVDRSEGNNQDVYNAVNLLINEWGKALSYVDEEENELTIDLLYLCCITHEGGKASIFREGLISSFIDVPFSIENLRYENGTVCNF